MVSRQSFPAAVVAAVFALGMTATALQAQGLIIFQDVVYSDRFDGDTNAVNVGIGGGGVGTNFNGGGGVNWGFNDVIETPNDETGLFAGDAASGNRISTYVSTNGFDVSNGFTLAVLFDQQFNGNNGDASTVPFNSNHFSFGLLTAPDTSGDFFANNNGDPIPAGIDAIGVSLGVRNGAAELSSLQWDNDAQTSLNGVLADADVIGNDLGYVLTVDAAGAYTWQILGTVDTNMDGVVDLDDIGASGSGTTNIDLSVPYFFKARTQGSSGNSIEFVSLSVPAVPEPSSFAVLGLGVVCFVTRRRRS